MEIHWRKTEGTALTELVRKTIQALQETNGNQGTGRMHHCPPPDRRKVIRVVKDLQALLFPMSFRREVPDMPDEALLEKALGLLKAELASALRFRSPMKRPGLIFIRALRWENTSLSTMERAL